MRPLVACSACALLLSCWSLVHKKPRPRSPPPERRACSVHGKGGCANCQSTTIPDRRFLPPFPSIHRVHKSIDGLLPPIQSNVSNGRNGRSSRAEHLSDALCACAAPRIALRLLCCWLRIGRPTCEQFLIGLNLAALAGWPYQVNFNQTRPCPSVAALPLLRP